MDELAKLRQQLEEEQRRRKEEQRLREDAENRASDEQRRREEEQRLREGAENRASDEQRRREEEQRRREEEQRRREQAEELSKASQPQNLKQYLEASHSLSLALQVVTEKSLTTQGSTTNPTGRIYPRRMIKWDSFAEEQDKIWNLLVDSDFWSSPVFPSPHQLDYVRSFIRPVSSEIGLRNFERDTVENAVQTLVKQAYNHLPVRSRLGLQGTITFESHTNLGDAGNATSESMEHPSNSADDAAVTTPPRMRVHRTARGKGNRADQFCIYRTSQQNAPTLAIEYKAPHKLSREEILIGLQSEIQPGRDVINMDGQGVEFESRRLAAAVITQLFSYMIGKSVQYGYVCTGEVFVFLYIPDDPTTVYYTVCVPNLDVRDNDNDENKFRCTAVAQVFAFILQSLRAEPPPISWHDRVEDLETWAVEYDDILKKIPLSTRKEIRASPSPYIPKQWKDFKRSPIRTRSRCKPPFSNTKHQDDDNDDDDEDEGSHSPNKTRPKHSRSQQAGSRSKEEQHGRGGQPGQSQQHRIQDRPYCTQQCLLGLAQGGSVDRDCPNASDHGQVHIERVEFLALVRAQLALDRGPGADCVPLYIAGARGALFKVRLSSHGYTLVAKGMQSRHLTYLQHEKRLYDQLQAIQGKHIPVCLGMLDLDLPYYYDCGKYWHFLLLSWAGRPLFDCVDQINKAGVINQVRIAFMELHKLRVVHHDAEPRNILCDALTGDLMIVDLERAEFQGRQPLSSIDTGNRNHGAKRGAGEKKYQDPFAQELQSVVAAVSRCIGL